MSRDIVELKQIERVFIAVRWVAVPAILILAWQHEPLSVHAMIGVAVGLALVNIRAWQLNRRIQLVVSQQILGGAMLAVDTAAVTVALSLFIYDFYTSAYAGFAVIVIEGAVRHALWGSVAMALFFYAALAGAMAARFLLGIGAQ